MAGLRARLTERPTRRRSTSGIGSQNPTVVRRLVEEEEPDYDSLDRVLPLAGLSAAEALCWTASPRPTTSL